MALNVSTVPQLKEYESSPGGLLKLESRPAGTYMRQLQIRGNSFLSSVYVKSLDPGATVKVNYYDFTTDEDLERNDLNSHDLVSVISTESDKILVTRFHDKPILEVVVSGGNAEFSVYLTVISDPLVEISGTIPIDFPDSGTSGDPIYNDIIGVESQIGIEKDILSEIEISVGKTRWLHTIVASCRYEGIFRVKIGVSTVLTIRNSITSPTVPINFKPARKVLAGEKYKVTFEATAGFPVTDVSVHMMSAEV